MTCLVVFGLSLTAQALVYQGLTNAPLGNAVIVNQLDHGSNQVLVVSNLGSSGQDGVSIALPGNLSGLDVGWQSLDDSNTLPVGAYIQEQMIGPANGTPDSLWGTLSMTKQGTSNYVVSADYSPLGASTYTVQAYLKGALVGQATNQDGASLAVCGGCCTTYDWEFWPDFGPTIDWGRGTRILLGGLSLTADQLYVIPENVPITDMPTAMQITASQVPVITITGENASLVYQGLTNTSVGNAIIVNQLDHGSNNNWLVVSNLGSSGQDGVSIAFTANLTDLEVGWQDLDVSNTLPVGAYIQSQTIGTANGITNGVWDTLTVTKQCAVCGGSNYVVSADFSPIGASNYTVQAYLHGVLVAQAIASNGAPLTVCGIKIKPDVDWKFGVPTASIKIIFGVATSAFAGGPVVTWDAFDLTPNGNNPLGRPPTAFRIVASQVPVITITSENVSLVYQGLTNTSLGNALIANQLDHGSNTAFLVVSNLGSSGQDGVSIDLPGGTNNTTGFDVTWQALDDADTLPVGAYIQEQMIGTAGAITNGLWGTLTMTKMGTSNYVVSADYSPLGASTYTVQAYLKGALVGQATNQPGASLAVCGGCCTTYDWELWPRFGPTIDWSDGTPTLLGGAAITCDRLYIVPENVAITKVPTAMQITASQVPALTITSESLSLVYQGLTNTSLASAALAVSGSQLVVSNLGSSGQDGVSITMPSNLTALEVHWLPLDPSNSLPVGAYVQEQVVGTANGITDGLLGTVTVTKTGTSNYVVSADYTPLGASTYTVQAYRNKVLVAQATNQPGASLAILNLPPQSGDMEPMPSCTCTMDWPPGGPLPWLTIAGLASVQCDHLYITPENVSGTPTAFQITASEVPALKITSENASMVYDGLTNTSLGNASMVYWGFRVSSNQLVVSNLGSSGQDGVEIALNPGNNFAASWLALDPSNALPVGAYVKSQMIGIAGAVTNGVLGTTTWTKAGTSNYTISVDYSPLGSSKHTVQVYNGATLVAQVTGQAASLVGTVKLPPGTCTINTELNQEWPKALDIAINGGPTVTGTEILMIPEGGTSVSSISAERILAAHIPSIIITQEIVSVAYAGLTPTPLGNASLSVVSNQLALGNLGSSGQDGVSFALPSNLPGLDIVWSPALSNTGPVGAYLQEQIIGTAGAITNGVLGTITMTKECAVCNGSNFVVSADFSPVGASTYTVQAYRNGALVAQATGQPGGALATCPIWGDSGCIPPIGIPPILKGGWDWPDPGPLLNIAGSAAVQCDHLFITPEHVPGSSTLTAFQITASQVPSLTVTAVIPSPLRVSVSQTTPQSVTLQWFGTGVLQESTNLGTWSDLPGATTPYSTPAVSAKKFYRVRQ
jgi:hypothetical protein